MTLTFGFSQLLWTIPDYRQVSLIRFNLIFLSKISSSLFKKFHVPSLL